MEKIRSNEEISRLFADGNLWKGRFLGVRYAKNFTSKLRLAITTGKKISKKAVVRNKVRRRIYEAARKNLDCVGAEKYDIVFVARAGIEHAEYVDIENDVKAFYSFISGKK